jgi:hypothetical protein
VKQVETYTVEKPRAVEATASWGTDRVNQRDLPLDGDDEASSTAGGVDVFVVDTGISPHADFQDRLAPDCFSATGEGCVDGHGHGTHCAGTVAGLTFGVAKGATLHAVQVLNSRGSGTTDQVVAGIEAVVRARGELGRPVVASMSLGGPPDPALDQAVCDAIDAGVTFAVAAGNDYGDDARDSSPARVLQAITVAASARDDAAAAFSNIGPVVDVWAPGVDIVSARPGGGSATMSGTSMATPHVAGGAAIALAEGASTPAQVLEALTSRATPGKVVGGGEGTTDLLLYVGKGEAPLPGCTLDMPWCKDVGQTCSSDESPCKHNPTQDPDHCEEAPACPDEPEPAECMNEAALVPVTGCGEELRDAVRGAALAVGDDPSRPPQETLDLVAAEIERQTGRCSVGGQEALFVDRWDGWVEENHLVHFGTGGFINGGAGKFIGCHVHTTCPAPNPVHYPGEFVLKKFGNKWDSTFRVRSREYCEAVGFPGRLACPVRLDGNFARWACENLAIGDQRWWCDGGEIDHTANPAQAVCKGHVQTCTADGRVCAEADW